MTKEEARSVLLFLAVAFVIGLSFGINIGVFYVR